MTICIRVCIYTYLCLRTENRARKTHVFEYRYFGVGWGGVRGGDVNVPCTSYMIHCYAAEISGIVYYVTCCYAADGVGWGVGDVNVPCTSYMIHCYAAEISGIVVMLRGVGCGIEKTIYRRNEKISCHTGTIDAAWSAVKNFIPNSLSSKSKDLLSRR